MGARMVEKGNFDTEDPQMLRPHSTKFSIQGELAPRI